MDIRSVGNNNLNSFTEVNKKQDVNPQQPAKAADKIEISKEAKLLQTNGASKKNLTEIREKITSGFYSKKEVIGKVAEKILTEIAPE